MSTPRRPVAAVPEWAGDARLAVRARAGDAAACDELVLRHGGLVRRLARGFAVPGVPQEDLVQTGYVALIRAAGRFDPARGVHFRTYAAAVVRGELRHVLRDQAWSVRVPRSLQEIGSAAAHERERLTRPDGSPPRVAEIAASLGVDADRVRDGLAAREAFRADPVDAAEDERLAAPDSGYERVERILDLAAALPRLTSPQREIMRLRFEQDLTQRAIATRLGLSQAHVSRLLRAGLDTLRALLEDAPAPEPMPSGGFE